MARASIIWLVGEYAERVPKVAPDVLRIAAKSFTKEVCELWISAFQHNLSQNFCMFFDKCFLKECFNVFFRCFQEDIVKLQIINLGAKLILINPNQVCHLKKILYDYELG